MTEWMQAWLSLRQFPLPLHSGQTTNKSYTIDWLIITHTIVRRYTVSYCSNSKSGGPNFSPTACLTVAFKRWPKHLVILSLLFLVGMFLRNNSGRKIHRLCPMARPDRKEILLIFFVYQSINQLLHFPINHSTNQPVNQSINHCCINQYINQLITHPVNNSIYNSLNHPIIQSIKQSFNYSIAQSITQLLNHLITYSNNHHIIQSFNQWYYQEISQLFRLYHLIKHSTNQSHL